MRIHDVDAYTDALKHRPASIAAALVLMALMAAGCIGCAPARKPLVDATTPVTVGCGPMPPAPTVCLETLAPDATAPETMRCYAETVAQLIADDRALRAQFGPCAK